MTMSNQPENEKQQIITPEEARQHLLGEIEVIQQAITELRDEELEEISGGFGIIGKEGFNLFGNGFSVGKRLNVFGKSAVDSVNSYQHSPTKQFLVKKVLPKMI
jgi:hypothetical protein